MSRCAVVWFRRDLRLADHPSLARASQAYELVVPAFVVDRRLLDGRFPSPNRAAFLHGCLVTLDAALRERGGALVVREGPPERALVELARETGAEAVLWAADVSPFAVGRDRRVGRALEQAGITPLPGPGNFVCDVNRVRRADGGTFTVFSPFERAWSRAPRREVEPSPERIALPAGLHNARLPPASAFGPGAEAIAPVVAPGESAGRVLLDGWLSEEGIDRYPHRQDRLAESTSRLSAYLRFGCLSAREVEEVVAGRRGEGASRFRRQLCWRDFFAHVLLHHPDNAYLELQERYRQVHWLDDDQRLDAWREGTTGFPIVDAGMRQLRASGWMPNRARLVVGSLLTKDLGLDWRAGEAHFMRHLLDGDEAQNNGNWQWIASVGTDPAPYFRRMYNPALQQRRFDPDGRYVRRWVPELARVPDELLAEPWTMTASQQRSAGCTIGSDYPAPIVDRVVERERTRARYRAASAI